VSHHRPAKVTWRWRLSRPWLNNLFVGVGMLLALTFVASTAAVAASGWTDFGAVSQLNQQPVAGIGSELVFVNVSVTSNPSGCSVPNGFYLAITTDRQTRLFAMLMTAQAGGRNVQIYVTGNCHTWGFAELDGVVIQ
jgi:hypothetical protein